MPQLVEKVRFLFCASCDSTYKIEFAQQIHKNRGAWSRPPSLAAMRQFTLCTSVFIQGKKKCVRRARFFFSIRSKAWFRSSGCSKNDSFSTASTPVKDGVLLYLNRKKKEWKALHSPLSNFHSKLAALQQTGRLGRIDQIGHAAQADAQRRQVVHHRRCCGS